jgi:lysophospholipase L1-like esterase
MQKANQPSQDVLSSRTKWIFLVSLTIITLLVILLVAELAIRIRQAAKYGSATAVEEFYTLDPKSGLRIPRAGFSDGHISINSLGFRGPEITAEKPGGTVRLAFLGASTTISHEVSGNDFVWPHLATASLSQAFPKAHFDYVNGGVSGYTVNSSLKNLEYRIAPLQPDVIVIYHATNDMSSELRELAATQGLIAEGGFQEFSWPGRYLVLWNLVEKNLRVMIAERAALENRGRLVFDPRTLGAQFRTNLAKLVHSAQKQAKVVAIATFSTHLRKGQTLEQQQRAVASAIFYMPFMTFEGLLASYERYNQIIREVASETGVLLIEGENDIPGTPAYFADSVHFNNDGSRVMANRVSQALVTNLAFRDTVTLAHKAPR